MTTNTSQHNTYHDHSKDDNVDISTKTKGGVKIPFSETLFQMLQHIDLQEPDLASIVCTTMAAPRPMFSRSRCMENRGAYPFEILQGDGVPLIPSPVEPMGLQTHPEAARLWCVLPRALSSQQGVYTSSHFLKCPTHESIGSVYNSPRSF